MTMYAMVIEIYNNCSLLVQDCSTGQDVVVFTANACRFRAGERILVEYSGAMTMSLPPQISADCIRRVSGCC